MPWRLVSRAPWNNIAGGSPHPEWWLSKSGQVAQTAPEYSSKKEYYKKYKLEDNIRPIIDHEYKEYKLKN